MPPSPFLRALFFLRSSLSFIIVVIVIHNICRAIKKRCSLQQPLCASMLMYITSNCQNNLLLSSTITQYTQIRRDCGMYQQCWTQDWNANSSNSRCFNSLPSSIVPGLRCSGVWNNFIKTTGRKGSAWSKLWIKSFVSGRADGELCPSPWEEGPICPDGLAAFRGPAFHRALQ